MSTIENLATGAALQYMVSTNGKTIHGKNLGLGHRTIQVGGYLSDTSLQQLSRELLRVNMEPQIRLPSSQIPSSQSTETGDSVSSMAAGNTNMFTPASTPKAANSSDSCSWT